MPPQSVEQRVQRLEQRVSGLEQLPARIAELGSQFVQLRSEIRQEFSTIRRELAERATLAQLREETAAIRKELRGTRGNGAGPSLAKLHEEIAALRGAGGEGLTLVGLRQEIRDGDQETRRLMRVLHEDLVQRIALLGEKPSSAGVAPQRGGRRGKKNHRRTR